MHYVVVILKKILYQVDFGFYFDVQRGNNKFLPLGDKQVENYRRSMCSV